MEEFIVHLSHTVDRLAGVAAILVVAFGTVEAFVRVVRVAITPNVTHGARKAIWRNYGMWLLLGLEFELAADIVGSIVSPTWEDVGMLGAIAVIRTFLNYFLGRDLMEAAEQREPEPPRSGAEPSNG
jgi:uncharacterized membrane protein